MNELELSNNLTDIEEEISFYSQRTQRSLWELGRRFKYVKEHDLTHGQFMDWYTNLGFNKNFVSDAINIAEEFPNFPSLGSFKSDTALRIASRLPKEEREKEHTLESGETKTVNEMTTRELEEVKRKNREQEKTIEEQQKIINEQANREPKVVEKEVPPHDYDGLKSDNQQLSGALKKAQSDAEDYKKQYEYQKQLYNDMLEERSEVDSKSHELDEIAEAINNSRGQLNDQQKIISDYKNVLKILRDTNNALLEIGSVVYLDVGDLIQTDQTVNSEFDNLIIRTQRLADDLRKMKNEPVILEGVYTNE